MSHKNPQRTAVERRAFGAGDAEAVAGEEGVDCGEGEIENVLVIDGVEFGLGNHLGGVREFENDAAFGREQCFEAGNEIVDVGRVGEDVVGKNEVG